MLFNSFNFLVIFLPVCFLVFTLIEKNNPKYCTHILIGFSVLFYMYWSVEYAFLLAISSSINFFIGKKISFENNKIKKKWLLIAAIATNLSVLGYFKYFNFFKGTLNDWVDAHYAITNIILPLGISFFTFQKIGFLVDCYKDKVKEHNYLDFQLFVWFFPQLIAGPIVHHKEVIPQFKQFGKNAERYESICKGLLLIILGLFKKIIIADNLAIYVEPQFDNVGSLEFLDAWTACIGYSLQLYFDFSAYSEMALGLALLFGIKLPINFNSPYKAVNISDFWRRWHITLGAFLRDYVYIPLGGSKKGTLIAIYSAFTTMLLGGFWHGAGWNFILWGGYHGILLGVFYAYKSLFGLKMNKQVSMLITLILVMLGWVLFRSQSVEDALRIYQTMFGLNGIKLPMLYKGFGGFEIVTSQFIKGFEIYVMLFLLWVCCTQRNVVEIVNDFKFKSTKSAMGYGLIASICMFNLTSPTSFQYFNF